VERRRYTRARLGLTHELVEGLAGYRTRLVHEAEESWHEREDPMLAGYAESARRADCFTALLAALVPRGWFVIGLLSLAAPVVHEQVATESLAVAFGALLLSYRALRRVVTGIDGALECSIAWEQLAPILAAATRGERPGAPLSATLLTTGAGQDTTLVEAHGLTYRHRPDREPVLTGLDLKISSGDRLLLLGDSGGGKSTLVSVLAGLREPQSGVLLHRGLDHATLGEHEWRRRIGLAPQFHENHVFANSFGFNALMGRRWPPTPEDIEETGAICAELGLAELIDRMPAGLAQMVGETGWQLSHGERSRLFIARALLQNPDVLILDESFGALDPDTFRRCLKAVATRARSLVVVAHP
jgi:ATP-binding cassette subfamily B protein